MADSTIFGLPEELFITALDDVLAIDDVDDLGAKVTKKIKIENLMLYPGQIGDGTPNTGEFTTLQLPSGATINEFSIDGTLSGDSDGAIPTEKAVKTYVDAQISGVDEHKPPVWGHGRRPICMDAVRCSVGSICNGKVWVEWKP